MGGPASTDVLLRPAGELARMLQALELSAVELLELHVARIDQRNGELSALVLARLDEARGEALAADRALLRGERIGPLHGIPFTAKDAIAVAGMRWPNGSRLFADEVAGYDAPAIRRMRTAGAILVGKTNVPELCSFYDTANDLFGATRNPHARDRSAGGSSGGEAATVASGMSALGLGSDLGARARSETPSPLHRRLRAQAVARACPLHRPRTGRRGAAVVAVGRDRPARPQRR